MKKIYELILAMFGVVVTLVGCGRNKGDVPFKFDSWKETVMAIADEEATPEQLALKRKIQNVIVSYVDIVDDRLCLNVGRDYFEKNDIPTAYYDLMTEEFAQTNEAFARMLETQDVEVDVAAALEKAKEELRHRIESADR